MTCILSASEQNPAVLMLLGETTTAKRRQVFGTELQVFINAATLPGTTCA